MGSDPYNMEEVVMPLHEYIYDPVACDIVHNGATFQVLSLWFFNSMQVFIYYFLYYDYHLLLNVVLWLET